MAQFQSYNKILISHSDQIVNYKAGDCVLGYVFQCQYPSYRGTYLSCIEKMDVYVDGSLIPEDKVYFNLNGKQFLVPQLKDMYQEYWFIMDKAKILVMEDGGLGTGEHSIQVKMRHRIPYTGYFGNYMVLDSSDKKNLNLSGEVISL